MKKMGLILAVFSLICSLTGADDVKRLTVAVNSLTTQEVPFKIESITTSDETILQVSTVEGNNREFRISGKKAGITDIQVRGGGMNQTFKVTVIANLELLLKDIKYALDAVPEVEISVLNDRLVLKGEISSIANLELKNKVIKSYGNVVMDLSTFRPTPEVLIALHKNLEKAGYKVVRKGEAKEPGEIAITQVGEMLTITGLVYSPEDLNKIKIILLSQYWLSLPVDGKTTGTPGKVAAYMNIQVMPVMLQVDVVHVAIDKTELQQIGNNISGLENFLAGAINLGGALSALKFKGSPVTQGGGNFNGVEVPARGGFYSMVGGGSLAGSLAFLGNNGITRSRRAGFLTFKSNDTPQFRKLHSGGTLYISSGANPGGSSQLKDIDYGLILEVKGGLTGKDNVSIELKQELSYPGPKGQFAQRAEIDIKKFSTTTSITCRLGETIAVGGLKEFIESNSSSDSIPYLRNIPGFKWLIAQDTDNFTETEILTLVCVHKMIPSGSVDPVAAELEKMKRAEDKKDRERERKEHKNDGKWYQFWKW